MSESRVRYWVLDQHAKTWTVEVGDESRQIQFSHDDVIMDTVLPEGEVFDPPPWVKHGIQHKGWKVVERSIDASGLVYHGTADWRSVSDALASALDRLMQQEDLSDPEPGEQASKALDDYRIAVTEVEMASPHMSDGESSSS